MNRAMKCAVFVCLVFAPCACFGVDTVALAKRLHNAADASSLDDAALKPWHLKVTFQLFDGKGEPTEEGTIEEWWSGGNYKRVYTSPSYNSTEIRRAKDLYRTIGQTSAPYLLDLLRDEIVHPMANDAERNNSVPALRVETIGKVKLDCIMLTRPMKNVAYSPLGLFPTYCLDQDKDRLRLSFRYGSENVTRNAFGTFQGRGVASETGVALSGVPSAKAHIAALAVMTEDDHFFDLDGSLQLQSSKILQIGPGVVGGAKISGAVPVYPLEDKQNHTSGVVHLHAIIGTDGHIHHLTVLDTPSPTLAISALTAVRQWVYKPYLLDGLPCSVETTINVTYNFGSG